MRIVQSYLQASRRQWNFPNAISLSRALMGITLPLWWLGGEEVLLLVIMYAGVSDWLDGWLARRKKEVTSFGAVIDPLADKCFTDPFLLGIAITTGSIWFSVLFAVTVLYDIDTTYQRRFDIYATFHGVYKRAEKPVTWLSKIKTAVLFVVMVFALYPATLPFFTTDQLAIIALALVLWSWALNRRTFIKRFLF